MIRTIAFSVASTILFACLVLIMGEFADIHRMQPTKAIVGLVAMSLLCGMVIGTAMDAIKAWGNHRATKSLELMGTKFPII